MGRTRNLTTSLDTLIPDQMKSHYYFKYYIVPAFSVILLLLVVIVAGTANAEIQIRPINKDEIKKPVGILKVLSNPSGANVKINGQAAGTTPVQHSNIPIGRIDVSVEKDGFVKKQKPVIIIADRRAIVRFQLSKKPKKAKLTVKTRPNTANVKLLNIKQKYTDGIELEAGEYHIEVSATDHISENRRIKLLAGDNSTLDFTLKPLPQSGSLEIISHPADSQVKIDGRPVGQTPLQLADLQPGTVEVSVDKKGYVGSKQVVDIKIRENTTVRYKLKRLPTTGRLTIHTEPRNANVRFLANKDLVYTRGMELDPGKYHIQVSAEEFTAENRWVLVKIGENNEENFNLKRLPQTGSLEINSSPPGGKIKINGRLVGKTPLFLDKQQPGKVEVSVDKKGYGGAKKTADIKIRENTFVEFILEPLPTTGQLTIHTEPPNAKVRFQGENNLVYKAGMKLKPREYNIEVSAEGFVPEERWVTIGIGKNNEDFFILRELPKTGSLEILSSPPGGQITIDGRYMGKTPLFLDKQQPRTVEVSIVKEGYGGGKKTADIKISEKSLVKFTLIPLPTTGQLTINAKPRRATVRFLGKENLVYKAEMELKPGEYYIEVSAEGFVPEERWVTIGIGKDNEEIFNLRELPKTGSLEILSSPPGGQITIDGRYMGKTPLFLDKQQPRTVEVSIVKEGYEGGKKTADIKIREKSLVKFTLIPLPTTGQLTINAKPRRATVRFLGKENLVYKAGMELKPGNYYIRVSAIGFETEERWVSVQVGKNIKEKFKLKELPKTGSLSITSQPTHVEISINGKRVGSTPVTLGAIQPGPVQLSASKKGHLDSEKQTTIKAGEQTNIHFNLSPDKGPQKAPSIVW